MLESPVDPLPLAGGVLGSTELPVPSVLELVPEVDGVEVCANEIPALNKSPSSTDIENGFFIISPAVTETENVQRACLCRLSCTHFQHEIDHSRQGERCQVINATVGEQGGKQFAAR